MSDARELRAMRALVRAVEGLEPDEERRVLAWFVASRTDTSAGAFDKPITEALRADARRTQALIGSRTLPAEPSS